MFVFQLSFQHKIGILYCKAGQSTEEEMYNNEMAGPAFEEFLDLLGQRVRLKGFTKYRAQLDNKSKFCFWPMIQTVIIQLISCKSCPFKLLMNKIMGEEDEAYDKEHVSHLV